MLTSDIQNTDPNYAGTDPSFFGSPDYGDISYTGDPTIDLPESGSDLCYVGETDPITGDTIGSCAGSAGSGAITDPSVTPTVVSSGVWQQIGGTLGAFLGGLTKFGSVPGSVPTGSKRCPNGQIVLNSQVCPGSTSASVLGGSGSSLVLILAVVLILVLFLRK